MATVTVRNVIDQQGIRALIEGPSSSVGRDMRRRANRVLNDAKRRCPVDQGKLRASLHIKDIPAKTGVAVGSNLDYAVYVHEGTGIYAGRGFIYPKRAKMLAWKGAGGKYVFAKKVRGQKAQPFLRDALPAARG